MFKEDCKGFASDPCRPIRMLLYALALVCVASMASAEMSVCELIPGPKIKTFSGDEREIYMPCNYWALRRQRCGNYTINLAPKQRWFGHEYQLESLWLSVKDITSGQAYTIRTFTKRATKAYNGQKDESATYEQKKGTLNPSLFQITREEDPPRMVIASTDGSFRLIFQLWHPNNREEYGFSSWRFECTDLGEHKYKLTNHSAKRIERKAWEKGVETQMCGGTAAEVEARRVSLRLDRTQDVYFYDRFNNRAVQDEEILCEKATNHTTKEICRKDYLYGAQVMQRCSGILNHLESTSCITKYSCSPMEIFSDCLNWGCRDKFEKDAKIKTDRSGKKGKKDTDDKKRKEKMEETFCEKIHSVLFFCPDMSYPNSISDYAAKSKCYKRYVPILETVPDKIPGQ